MVDDEVRGREDEVSSRYEVEFLAARLPETERDARAALQADPDAAVRLARWALRDCAAKRRLIRSWRRFMAEAAKHRLRGDEGAAIRAQFAATVLEMSALTNLIEPYSGHPDYQPEYPPPVSPPD